MSRPTLAITLGLTMGAYQILSAYVFWPLPPGWGVLAIVGAIAIPVAVLWPTRFDAGRQDGWLRRLGGRLAVAVGSGVAGGLTAFLIVSAVPSYLTWVDGLHRASLQQQGKTEAEIVAALAAHHQVPTDFLGEGFIATAVPGTLASGLTTAIGGVLSRTRRP